MKSKTDLSKTESAYKKSLGILSAPALHSCRVHFIPPSIPRSPIRASSFALAVYYSSTIFSSIPPPAKLARANRTLPDAVLNIAETMPEYVLALTGEVLPIAP
jgi:hypothetical protein